MYPVRFFNVRRYEVYSSRIKLFYPFFIRVVPDTERNLLFVVWQIYDLVWHIAGFIGGGYRISLCIQLINLTPDLQEHQKVDYAGQYTSPHCLKARFSFECQTYGSSKGI